MVYMSTMTSEIVPEWTQGDRLGKALKHAGIKVQDMADYLGMSRNTVGRYINDHGEADRRTLMLWAMRTGLPLEWLETGVAPADNGPDGGSVQSTDWAGSQVRHLSLAA